MSTLLIFLLLLCVVFLKAKNLEPFFNSSFLLCEFVVVHNVLIDRFEQVNEAKDQKRQRTTHSHCGSSLLVSSKLPKNEGGQEYTNIPVLTLILPAIAFPPITAPAVQHPCPTSAPIMTYQ